ncbi:MAG: glycosyltransferase family 4 protein [Sphingobacteriales bacterium]|nr:glycosyltransferase family 4 protein [Sphingobacteriales bacterium]
MSAELIMKFQRICFISPKSYPLFNPAVRVTFGGAEVQMSLLAKQWAKQYPPAQVHAMVADYGQAATEVREGVTLWKSICFDDALPKQITAFFKAFRQINAQVYIQRTLSPFSGIIAGYCRKNGKKMVFMVAHDAEADGTHPVFNKKTGGFMAKLVYRWAHLTIVQNEYEYDCLKKKYPNLPLAILKKGLILPALSLRPPAQYDAVWVGRCEAWKNPEIFLQLCAALPQYRFAMVCPPATDQVIYFEQVRQKAQSLHNLVFYERMENTAVVGLLQESRIFCLTSDLEGDWPMTVLEAAACGVAVFSYRLNYAHLIDTYSGGRHFGGNFEQMKNELSAALQNENDLKLMQEGARTFVEQHHDISVQTQKLHELLESLS